MFPECRIEWSSIVDRDWLLLNLKIVLGRTIRWGEAEGVWLDGVV